MSARHVILDVFIVARSLSCNKIPTLCARRWHEECSVHGETVRLQRGERVLRNSRGQSLPCRNFPREVSESGKYSFICGCTHTDVFENANFAKSGGEQPTSALKSSSSQSFLVVRSWEREKMREDCSNFAGTEHLFQTSINFRILCRLTCNWNWKKCK